MHFVLPLNETRLVYLPEEATSLPEPYVAQVTIKSSKPQNVDILCAYMLDQRDITELVMKLIISHMNTPLPANFVICGDRFSISANRKKWAYGRKLRTKWGDVTVKPCEDKWTFAFSPEDREKPAK